MDNENRKNNGRERANKSGRSVKGAAEKLKYRVTVKMATADYYLLKSKAKLAGVSTSEFIRDCITKGGVKERLSKEHGDLVRKLCGMANNLNQLAKKANVEGYASVFILSTDDRDGQPCKPDTPMIAKIMKDSAFKGVVYYILNDDKSTEIIDFDGLFLENNNMIAQGFIGQAQMNPRVTKAVEHIALSFSKEDAPRLNNALMAQIAREYMERMGVSRKRTTLSDGASTKSIHMYILHLIALTITVRPLSLP